MATGNAAGVGGVFSQSTKLLHPTTKPAKTQSWQDKNAAALARGTIPRPLLALQATHNNPTIFYKKDENDSCTLFKVGFHLSYTIMCDCLTNRYRENMGSDPIMDFGLIPN